MALLLSHFRRVGRVQGGGETRLIPDVSRTELRDELLKKIYDNFGDGVERWAKEYLRSNPILVTANADLDEAYTKFESESWITAQ